MGKGKKSEGKIVINSREDLEQIISQQPRIMRVPLANIRTLPQMRKTFDPELLDVLADNIKLIGLISPITLNQKTGLKHPILVAGERRKRAFEILNERYGRVFSSIPANVFRNLTQIQHNIIQAAENSYVPVPSAEAAESYSQQYEVMKADYETRGKKLTKAFFSRAMGRHESTILDALRFSELPGNIRGMAKKKLIPYGAAVQIARLDDSKHQREIADLVMANGYNEDKARQMVQAKLDTKNQGDLLDGFMTSPEELEKTIVDILGKNAHGAGMNSAQYMMRLIDIIKHNKKYNPLVIKSVRETLEKINKASGSLIKYKKKDEKDDNYAGPIISIKMQ